jgi:hypothetical protein
LFMTFLNRLEEEQRQSVYTIIQLTALIESRSCIKDKTNKRKNVDDEYYNTFVVIYPAIQYQYRQFLKQFNKADQAMLNKIVDRTKATALKRCKLLFNTK